MPEATAIATMSTIDCCSTGAAPLTGMCAWTCPECKKTWNCAGFENIPYGKTVHLTEIRPTVKAV